MECQNVFSGNRTFKIKGGIFSSYNRSTDPKVPTAARLSELQTEIKVVTSLIHW